MDTVCLRILLSRTEAGRLIGLKGANIDSLRQTTKTNIHIDNDGSSKRVATITGPFMNVCVAAGKVSDSIENPNIGLGRKGINLILQDHCCKLLGRLRNSTHKCKSKKGKRNRVLQFLFTFYCHQLFINP